MSLFDRLFGNGTANFNGNFINELFAAPTARKIDLARASMTSMACLHEAGHILMAERHGIPINSVNLPRFDTYSSDLRPGETLKEAIAGVGVSETEVARHVPFLLGGILGEINVHDDEALTSPEAMQVFTYGARGDVKRILAKIKADQTRDPYYLTLAANLAQAQAVSRDCAEREIFLTTFTFRNSREFMDFRDHRSRHQDIAAQLYDRWKHANFERYYERSPQFGAYRY